MSLFKVQDAVGNWWLECEEQAHAMATPDSKRVFFGTDEPAIISIVSEDRDHGNWWEQDQTLILNHGVTVTRNEWQEIGNSCAYGTTYAVSGRPVLSLVRRSDERQRVQL